MSSFRNRPVIAALILVGFLPISVKAQESLGPPAFTKFVCPAYPSHSRLQGTALIEIIVAKSGEPKEIHALEGHPMLIAATMDAAKRWRFRPYRLNGIPVEMSMRIDTIFALTPRTGYRCRIKIESTKRCAAKKDRRIR